MSPLFAFLVIVIVPAIYGNIEIDIVASQDAAERQIHMRGDAVDIITDMERDTFQLTDERLKKSVQAYFGARPDDAFLRSPTPWGDLYDTFSWSEVARALVPAKSKVLSVRTEPEFVWIRQLQNDESAAKEYYTHIHHRVENTVSSVWKKDGDLNVGQEIKYDFNIKGEFGPGKRLAYTAKWGENVTKSETLKIGSENALKITLEPLQAVALELEISKVSMKAQLNYEATLSGAAAVSYSKLYKGHRFWGLDISGVMSAGGMMKNVMSSEMIELVYYTDAKVIIRDVKTNRVLYTMPMEFF